MRGSEKASICLRGRGQASQEGSRRLRPRARNVIKRGPSEQQELDFEDSENEEDEDDWKTVLITDALKLTEKQIDKLFSVGVETVGDFEVLRAGTKDHPRGLIDVKGVGASTIDRWKEELLDWFDRRTRREVQESAPGSRRGRRRR